MPKSARLLKFPSRSAPVLYSAEESRIQARNLLSIRPDDRTSKDWEALEHPDVTLAVLELLKSEINSTPDRVRSDAAAVFERLKGTASVGLFDERDYFLGEAALLAGNAGRLLGRFEESENWFDLADISFRHTVNSAPLLTRVSHARLVLRYEMKRYAHVLALLPSVIAEYERLGMIGDLNKAKFLHGATFKESGDPDKSLECLLALRDSFGPEEPAFRSLVHTSIAEEYGRRGDTVNSLLEYEAALRAIDDTGDAMASQGLKGSLGEAYRAKGDYVSAITCLRSAVAESASLGMEARVAYLRVILAESLLAAGRDREAEWELLSALPTIDSQKMVAEGFAAVELLKQSVARRKTDPRALTALRQHLQNS